MGGEARRRWRIGTLVAVLMVVGVVAALWIVWSGSRAVAELTVAQDAVRESRAAAFELDTVSGADAVAQAQASTAAAYDYVHDPVWSFWAAIPKIGDTADAVRGLTESLVIAAEAGDPLQDAAVALDPAKLQGGNGLQLGRIESAQVPLADAESSLDAALAVLDDLPGGANGGWVLPPVASATDDVGVELDEAYTQVTNTKDAVDLLPTMLGSDGPRHWLVALQTPAEARGTGGLVGTWVLLRADRGRLSVADSGSNSDFSVLPTVPIEDEDFRQRYGQDVRLFTNVNLSPHFPYTGELTEKFWERRGEGPPIDGVIATDPVALGYMVRATGPIELSDGRTLTPANTADFATSGIYSAYPDRTERKVFQEEVATQVFAELTSGDVDYGRAVDALGRSVSEGRLLVWSTRPGEQQEIEKHALSGSLEAEVATGPSIHPAVINKDGSKLNVFLERDIDYRLEMCESGATATGVTTLTLSNILPAPGDVDPFVLGKRAKGGLDGYTVNDVQIHLGRNSTTTSVTVDGEDAPHTPFIERGRTSVVLQELRIPGDGTPVVIEVTADEPGGVSADLQPRVVEQPLAEPATINSRFVPCED